MSLVFHDSRVLHYFGWQTAQFTHVHRGLSHKLLTTPVAMCMRATPVVHTYNRSTYFILELVTIVLYFICINVVYVTGL